MIVSTDRRILDAFSVRNFAGLGAMSEARAKYCMAMYPIECTAAELQEARDILYPAQTQSGNLVSQQDLDTGQYVISDEGFAVPVSGSNAGGYCPKPVKPPMPALIPAENCNPSEGGPPNVACVEANYLRQQHNDALIRNRSKQYNQDLCEQSNCLNRTSRNCAAEFPLEPVPYAPGTAVSVAPDQYGILRPDSGPVYQATSAVIGQPSMPAEPDTVITATEEQGYYPSSESQQPFSLTEQLSSGFQEVGGQLSSATGLSSKTLLLIAAALGIYLVVK